MIIFPKEMKFLYDHHRKGDEPWRKIPTGICKARRHYIDSITDILIQGCSGTIKAGFRIQLGRPSLPSAFAKNEMYRWPTRRIVFPVTILSKRGSASLILIMTQKEIKNPPFWIEKGWIMHVKRTCSQAHLPIARRSNGCTKQAVLLTLLPRASSLPDLLKSVTSLDSLCITVAGPCRSFTGLPY